MLGWIVLLIVLATLSGLLGFAGITNIAVGLAQDLFAALLMLIVASVAIAALRRR